MTDNNNTNTSSQSQVAATSTTKKVKQWFADTSIFVQGLDFVQGKAKTIDLSDLASDSGNSTLIDTNSDTNSNKTGNHLGNRELPETLQWLLLLKQHQVIQSMDYHFACFMYGELVIISESGAQTHAALTRAEINLILLLSAKLSYDMSLQDSCLNLELINLAQPFGWLAPELQSHSLTQNVLAQCAVTNTDMQDILLRSGLVEDQSGLIESKSALAKEPQHTEPQHIELLHDETPLVLFQQCLYMRRYFNYEHSVVKFISQNPSLNISTNVTAKSQLYWFDALSNEQVESTVAELFPQSQQLDTTSNEIDWQKQAVINSITKSFSVISGGPGTGKTTTVVKLLAALVQLYKPHDSKSGLNIQLTAPTGKAAQRLAESISNSLTNIDVDQETKRSIPNKAVTIHRLLKPQGLNDFAYNENNKLFLDVLIVDEASMVDLSLMSKLLSAVPAHAQVILLGDKQQLSSVETGNVLSELCRPETQSLNLVVELKKSYRFNAAGLIGRLATEINLGNSHKVISLLSEHANTDTQKLAASELNWIKPELDNYHLLIEHSFKHQLALIEKAKAFSDLQTDIKTDSGQAQNIATKSRGVLNELFNHLQQFQILTCVKDGEHGIEGINRHIKTRLASRRLVNQYEQHYHCRPIMISENAYHLGLYNGDIGLQLIDGITKQLMTYFIQADGEVLTVACQRLPKHETVYAMTVHKSQGSEFSHVALVLPEPNQNNKILSKEILYTGLTRAKKQFTLFGQAQEIQQAVNKATVRQSGLSLMLKANLK
ncbi:hypothetical protein GCM10008107_24470 [Psychrosphaera saromensis]|uniref:RecBCD enzyme subunit RecD n=1 Tax=Psychrosphaera saromensis TaxID=716813 RepID=A0A2S7UYJ3_9GAMM|nr:exodeoxyribonuclease V subunit alpha [Psychrosphaera saromensis]PQJ54331.1 exodeoxyribonuclease V subunit alpha [Psychrosphaera saromensis]GHB74211.1 hypothetical protein GCM10008107_24470 [Psychrosphaera saromensis]GLQ12560.1 hypothetical protein GCM10007917_00150 [Psychrosphaera saromensis]